MIKPNWDVFKAKYSENPQNSFEWFCYLLFCKEFNLEYGIFRYKNQSAIETDPVISKDDNVVAWQAKFYETPLSNHKNELEGTLNKLKRDYPDVNVLYIYSNQEWGQHKGQKPQGLKEIEKLAETLKINLEWKLASFFESEFVVQRNETLAKHFFTLEKSLYSTLEEMQHHSENLLKSINTTINFNYKKIEIDREEKLKLLSDDLNQVCIISGSGGIGKTSLIKKFYEKYKESTPFFIFKATEFELRSINDMFDNYSLRDFIDVHKDVNRKIIVIDSAEKLLDLKNSEPFKEFLTVILEDNWKVIFTTRDSYLKDLNYQFFEVYKIAPLNIGIHLLKKEELTTFSKEYSFPLPIDEKLQELIRNPFYLNEYLKFYKSINEINYVEFKSHLWEQRIKKSNPKREQCFIEIAFQRAKSGQFFIDTSIEMIKQCDELVRDGMLGHEVAGYFITHDIYEEWALEKIINKEFINMSNEYEFFESIGNSLPIRRCFRNWISEKLLLEDYEIIEFIEDIIKNNDIPSFWKDELFASILLSDYSKHFFDIFKSDLLSKDWKLLKRLTFILRIACKEVDEEILNQLGFKEIDLYTLDIILTKPNGTGWETLIEFVYNNLELIGSENIDFILPVLNDWNEKFRIGTTTKYASLIALKFYQDITFKDIYNSQDSNIEIMIKTIINGSIEIKTELKNIIIEITENEWRNHRDPYNELSNFILTKFAGLPICLELPDEVLKLADLYWTYKPRENYLFSSGMDDLEHDFGIEKYGIDYMPPSAYQTPIYCMLKKWPNATIDFIVNFTNKSIKKYIHSDLASSLDNVTEVEIELNNGKKIKQYVSPCLWEIYRGTSSPVSPNLLQSLHMALEKYLLDLAKKSKDESLVDILSYILENSVSASITSVVTSVVLANPEKTFDIAKILFKTKQFIMYDTHRLVSEKRTKHLYSIGRNMGASNKNDIYDNERLLTCEDKHREYSLENLFLNYQLFSINESKECELKKRRKDLWEILDNFYSSYYPITDQSNIDKTWRLYLARMDSRKLKIKTENIDEGILIEFEPEKDPEIDAYREEAQKLNNEQMRYIPLKLWTDLKFRNDNKSKDYKEYEDNPQKALMDAKELLEKLNDSRVSNEVDELNVLLHSFNNQIPSVVCAVLIEHYANKLNNEEKFFCKNVIISKVMSCFKSNYIYQTGDGLQECISSLPKILNLFPEEKETIKSLLLLILLKDESVGGIMAVERFNIFSIAAIHKLWDEDFETANSLLIGYLVLKPKYIEFIKEIRKNSLEYSSNNINSRNQIIEFANEYENVIDKIIENEIYMPDIVDIQKLDFLVLSNAFKIMPSKLKSEEQFLISYEIISKFAEELTKSKSDIKVNYVIRQEFLGKYSHLVLNSDIKDISRMIKPFIVNFNSSEPIAELFQNFISAECVVNSYDNFWFVWNEFKDQLIILGNEKTWYLDDIIKSYLFAKTPWNDSIKNWNSLRENNMRLVKDISEQLGEHSSVLYSISKLLNDIGSSFYGEGLIWISNMLTKYSEKYAMKLEINTSYYLENLVRKYVYYEREKIRKNKKLKQKILVILNFLIERGSTISYILRERII